MTAAQNSIDQALDELSKFYWLDSLSAELSGLHRDHGQPDVPAWQSRSPTQLPFLHPSKLDGLGPYQSLALDAYNNAVKSAYRCIGWEHIGLFMAVGGGSGGSTQWKGYYTAALEAINQFFCSDAAWIEFDAYILEPAQRYLSQNSVR